MAAAAGKHGSRCMRYRLLSYYPHDEQTGSCYSTEEAATRQERKEVRARASLQALDRGDVGCLMSPVDMARAMAGLLRMHQSQFEMQVLCKLCYSIDFQF